MAFGLFKKMVIADRLAIVVNEVYNNPTDHGGQDLIIATIFFAFQIYCDFSGYSDIAIGISRTLGFDLMKNFKTPYFATSITDFWRRWHISLSSWFKDYVYIPLGGSRKSEFRVYLNLFFAILYLFLTQLFLMMSDPFGLCFRIRSHYEFLSLVCMRFYHVDRCL